MSGSAAPKSNYMFFPRTLEPVQVDKVTLKLYPIINSTLKPPECTHAFQINQTALAAPGIDRQMMFDNHRTQLNLSTIVDSVLGNWHRHFCHNWSNFAKLTILSFHNKVGNQVDDTITAADSAILLPVQDRSVPDCCKKYIRFVRV
jgi:hypothetical protein